MALIPSVANIHRETNMIRGGVPGVTSENIVDQSCGRELALTGYVYDRTETQTTWNERSTISRMPIHHVVGRLQNTGLPTRSTIRNRLSRLDANTLYQLGGLTGMGWTTSVIGYVTTLVTNGSTYLTRVVTEPTSLLYAAGVFFLLTLGCDRLASRLRSQPD